MTTQHTPGRAYVLPNYRDTVHADKGNRGRRVCNTHSFGPDAENEANAQWIAQCWNACIDMHDPEAEVAALRKDSEYLGASEKLRSEALAKCDTLLKALEQYKDAFDELFAHCCSNGVYNAWGKPMDCSAINAANGAADRAIKKVTAAGGAA